MARRFLLAVDLDGTLLGDAAAEQAFCVFYAEHRARVTLAYITGRRQDSVEALIASGTVPAPQLMACSVGTVLLDRCGGGLGERYAARAPAEWPRELLRTRGAGPGLTLQPDCEQGPHKLSFFWDGQPEHARALAERLAGIADVKTLHTAGRYIDLLPSCFGKGAAVQFLQEELELAPEEVVVAGDMGHDAEMYGHGFLGIVPANALEELRAAPKRGRIYESEHSHAAAVLAGLRWFGLL